MFEQSTSVQLRLPATGNRKFEAKITALPATVIVPASSRHRFSGLMMGGFFTILGYTLFHSGAAQGWLTSNTLLGLGLAIYGSLTIAKALVMPKGQTTMKFEKQAVSVSTQGWLTKNNWQAPYASFRGVKLRTKQTPSSRITTPYQIIEFINQDKTKTLPLYAARQKTPPTHQLAHYATIFGVTILNEQTEDVTKPV